MNPSTSPRTSGNWALLNDELRRLAALFPEAGHNGRTLRLVAEEWAALLKAEEATGREFLAALALVKRRRRFFPTVADLNDALREIREHPPVIPEHRRLAEPPHTGLSEARKARIRQCREIVAAQFARKISPAEATRQIDALYAQA